MSDLNRLNPIKNKSNRLVYAIIAILIVAFLGFEYSRVGDFKIYLDAAKNLLLRKNIYGELYGNDKVFPYMGSPTIAFLLSPLTFLKPTFASLLWNILNLFLLYRIWKIILFFLDVNKLNDHQKDLLVFASFSSLLFIIYKNFHLTQFTILLLYAVLEGVYQSKQKKHPVFGMMVLGLGIVTKLLPLVAIPYLFYRGKFRSLAYLAVSILFFVWLPAIYTGTEQCLFLYKTWLTSINPMNQINVFDLSSKTIHGIGALISILTIDGIGNMGYLQLKRNIVDINPEIVIYIIYGVKIGLVIFSLYFLRYQRIFKDHQNKLFQFRELSYILLITPLIFPQQRTYEFFFIFPAISYVLYGFLIKPELRRTFGFYLYILGVLLLNLELILGHFREIYWFYKILTYGVLILLALIIWMNPKKLIDTQKAE